MKKIIHVNTVLLFLFQVMSPFKIVAQIPTLVKDINTQSILPISSAILFAASDAVYFNTMDNGGESFWRSDGTTVGTYHVSAIELVEPTAFIGLTYFSGLEENPNSGTELWVTDGTTPGTHLVKDINAGDNGSNPSRLTVCNNRLFFFANQKGIGYELWNSDGTESGTQLVKDIWAGKNWAVDDKNSFLIALGNKVVFAAGDSATGTELYISDGTAGGTMLVKEITAGPGASWFFSPVVLNDAVYFFAGSSKTKLKL
jgi:ELWxxDGT repeat protein